MGSLSMLSWIGLDRWRARGLLEGETRYIIIIDELVDSVFGDRLVREGKEIMVGGESWNVGR